MKTNNYNTIIIIIIIKIIITIFKLDFTDIRYLRFLGGTWYGSYKHFLKKAKHDNNNNNILQIQIEKKIILKVILILCKTFDAYYLQVVCIQGFISLWIPPG